MSCSAKCARTVKAGQRHSRRLVSQIARSEARRLAAVTRVCKHASGKQPRDERRQPPLLRRQGGPLAERLAGCRAYMYSTEFARALGALVTARSAFPEVWVGVGCRPRREGRAQSRVAPWQTRLTRPCNASLYERQTSDVARRIMGRCFRPTGAICRSWCSLTPVARRSCLANTAVGWLSGEAAVLCLARSRRPVAMAKGFPAAV
jgi:hypothetical protein